MSAPAWFDSKYYRTSKLDSLHEEGYTQYDPLSLGAAFLAAGYTLDDDGMYRHFQEYGNSENVSPNSFFDADYYFQSKAQSYFGVKNIEMVTDEQVKFIKSAFAKAGLSAWDHYTLYGMKEGIDPNANFSTNAYFEAKLALLQESDPSYTSVDQVIAAFQAAGFNPITHYYQYGVNEGITPQAGSHGATLQQLTANIDDLTGTLGDPQVDENGDLTISDNYNDYFNAEVGTLQSADSVDGYRGQDTFYARLTGDGNNDGVADDAALEPTIVNVETVLFRAETASSSSSSHTGEISSQDADTAAKVYGYIDADRIYLADGERLTIGSDNSRLDLKIEDIRHDSSETTIRFADADPEANLWVYFDPQHLKAESAEKTATLEIEIEDVKNAQNNGQPLTEQPFNMFTFAYSESDDFITFAFRDADKALYTGTSATYTTLLTAFQHGLADFEAANPDLAGVFTVSLGDSYDATAVVGSDTYSSSMGQYVVIKSNSGTITTEDENGNQIDGTGWGVSTGYVPAKGGIVWGVNDTASETCPLIEVMLELDNVGRVQWDDASEQCLPNDIIYGSNAGDVEVGSMAMRGGVERIDVKVDKGSWLSGLYSTNDALRMVTVEAKDINGDGYAGNSSTENGQLYIGTWDGKLDDNGNYTTNNTTGIAHFTWTDPAKLLHAYTNIYTDFYENADKDDEMSGLKDVAVFDATESGTAYAGDINIAAVITEDSYDKYLKSVDGVRLIDQMFAPNAGYDGAFTYITGTGNDVVNMAVAGDIAADTDFEMNINTGNGKDLVAFRYYDMSDNQSFNQKYLQNATINTGADSDTVWFYTETSTTNTGNGGSVVVNTGAGNDVVYANQVDLFTGGAGSGVTDGPDNYNAVFVYNTKDTSVGLDDFDGATLNNDTYTGPASFNFLHATDDGTYTGANSLYALVKFKGFTSEAKIDVDFRYASDGNLVKSSVDADALNHAIIEAVNGVDENHPTSLSDLLVAKDGAGHSLIIESLANGAIDTGDLEISFSIRNSSGNYVARGVAGDQVLDGFSDWYATKYATWSDGSEFAGQDNIVDSQVVVNADAGNDTIVLATNEAVDVIELSSSFGNDKVVGFETAFDNPGVFSADADADKLHDLINVRGLGYSSFSAVTSASALVSKNLAIVDGHKASAYSGVFTSSEINKLISDKAIAFASSAASGAKALVVLHDADSSGASLQYGGLDVYTFAEVTNGSTPTATILGSLAFDESSAVKLTGSDFTNSSDLVVDPTVDMPA